MFLRPSTRDDREAPCGAVSIRALTFGDDTLDPTDRKALMRRLQLVLKRASSKWSVGHLWATLACLVLMGSAMAYNGPYESMVFLVTLVFSIWLSTELVRWFSRRQVTRTIVAEGLCGSCGYTLRDLEPESDGCVVCPECGAAWLAARIARPYWIPKELPTKRTHDPQVLGPDARGAYVRLVDHRLSGLTQERRAELGDAELRRLRRMIWERQRPARLTIGGLTGLVVMAGTLLIWHAMLWFGPAAAWLASVSAGTLMALLAMLLSARLPLSRRSAARALVRAHRCGSCADDLTGIAPDPDGYVTCGCCGAAWQVTRDVQEDQA